MFQRKVNGVDVSIDVSELENMTDEQIRKRYETASKGSAGVPGAGGEDFSDMIAKEMSSRQKKQKTSEAKRSNSSKEFKF